MDQSIRRHLFLAAVLLVVALLASGSITSSFAPSPAHNASAASADANASFDPFDTRTPSFAPPALIAGQPSHQGLISPIIVPTMNAYCVTVTNPAVSATGASLGFVVSGGGQKVATVPDAQRTNGSIVAVKGPIASITVDVKYCIQIKAAVGWTQTILTWNYTGAPPNLPISVAIQTANIVLERYGGTAFPAKETPGTPLGRPAELCTIGWSGGIGPAAPLEIASAFLTGRGSIESDKVGNANWVIPAGSSTPGVTFVGNAISNQRTRTPIVGQTTPIDSKEQCVVVSATANAGPAPALPWVATYTFDFGSIYQPWLVVTPPVVGDAKFVQGVPELYFPNDPGSLLSPMLVTYAPVTVCISGTNQADVISTAGVYFTVLGGPDAPNVVSLSVSNGQPRCLTWTSSLPGEQTLTAGFTWDPDAVCSGSPVVCVAGPQPPVPVIANWDSDRDGNGQPFTGATAIVIQWNRIDSTRLTSGVDPATGIVTNTNIVKPVSFNIADGTFIFATTITEWVFGSHNSVGYRTSGVVDGARIRASISGGCGYFDVPTPTPPGSRPQIIEGVSVGGRIALDPLYDSPANLNVDDIKITILNDKGCGINSAINLSVDVYYPGQTTPALSPPETLGIAFTFVAAQKVPQFAWAGRAVTITYAVSAASGSCAGATVSFARAGGQPGTFLPSPGITVNGPDHAVADFGTCSSSVIYESQNPGEVDIEAFISPGSNVLLRDSAAFSKIAFPVYFMLLEDVTITATPTTVVSTPGSVSAKIRGYFVGTNPSGRLAEKKPDGRTTPADRWVLPDDYDKLRGDAVERASWPSTAPMPPARVTFQMQDEGVRNSFQTGVKNGGVGWFLADDILDTDFNINPLTQQPSILGSLARPRIMSSLTDTSGNASVATFGDLNLSYEACARSPINGNPLCKPDDVVGHTTYFAVADYPFAQKKFGPIISNSATTEWTWFGYKSVTVVNTDSPQIKYVVAHLRDRDGFCDAADFNNVLGVPVRFEIDAGGGKIIEAADRPYTVSGNGRFAVATTFDIRNDLNLPMNVDIARTAVSPDECQAWIKITNSLMQPTNVTVTFPAPPSPVPGNVRVTGLTCTGAESVTVTNQGKNPVSLAGFSFLSPPQNFAPFEYFGLDGHLDPGQSLTFPGGPGATKLGWLFSGDAVFADTGNDYVSLVWDGFEIDRVYCDGRPSIHNAIPASFPLDGEGETVIDIVVPFGVEKPVELVAGWNLLTAGSTDTVIADAIAGKESLVNGIYLWDPVKLQWGRYIPGAPTSVNTISKFEKGKIYWVQVNQPFTLMLLK